MINLLVDLHSFDGKPEGITTYLQGIYSALIPMTESSFHLYLCASDIPHLQSIFGHYPHVDYVQIPRTGLWRRLLFIYPGLIRRYSIDYAHFQYTVPFRCSCKRIVTIHDIFFEDFKEGYPLSYRLPRHFLFKYAARHAEFVFTMCTYCRERIAAHYGIPQDAIGLTPNAVYGNFANDVLQSTEDIKAKYGITGPYILYLSRKEPRKNHLGLARAFVRSGLWMKGVTLALVGGVSLPISEFDSYFSQLSPDIRQWIRCIDHVEYPELCSWYRQATAFAFPSLAEGFGIPPLEAAVCGLPVLCSNKTSMGEFTFFGHNLADPENEEDWAKKLQQLVAEKDPPGLSRIAGIIQRTYSWEQSAEELRKTIETDYRRSHSAAVHED